MQKISDAATITVASLIGRCLSAPVDRPHAGEMTNIFQASPLVGAATGVPLYASQTPDTLS